MESFPDKTAAAAEFDSKPTRYEPIQSPGEEPYQLPHAWRFTSKRFIAANVLCFVLFAWTIICAFSPLYLDGELEFSATKRTVYTTCIAVLASMITLYLASHMRSDWLRVVDMRLPSTSSPESIHDLNSPWRAALGIATPKERWYQRRSTWLIQLSLAFAALLTTSLVASMTPTTSHKNYEFTLRLPTGDQSGCFAVFKNSTGIGSTDYVRNITWTLPNGNSLAVGMGLACPGGRTVAGLGTLNDFSPVDYSYSVEGTAIQNTAIGVSESLLSYVPPSQNVSTPLQNLTDIVGMNLATTKQCIPVLSSNPVTCRPSHNAQVVGNNTLTMATSPTCNFTRTYNIDLRPNETAVTNAGICGGSSVGTGTILIGGTNFIAADLILFMNDTEWADSAYPDDALSNGHPIAYSIACDFDVARAITWREVSVDFGHRADVNVPFSRLVTGGDTCLPQSNLTTAYAALAASGWLGPLQDDGDQSNPENWLPNLLDHVTDLSGVHEVAEDTELRGGPYAFAQSKSAIDDVLGLMAGIAMSKVPLVTVPIGDNNTVDSLPMFSQQARATISVVRIGPGSGWAILFAIPPAVAWFFVIWLRLKISKGRPVHFSSQMVDLVRLGQYRDLD